MNIEPNKLICRECNHRLLRNERLVAIHPFDPETMCCGCPECRSIDCFAMVCDEPGCKEEATCGTPCKEHRYRHTCGRHMPKGKVG